MKSMEYTKDIRIEISTLLALGKSNQEIVDEFQTKYTVSEDEIITVLRLFYDNWQNTVATIDAKKTDHLNWHIFMRHQALQIALDKEQSGGALSILNSLAKLQGLSDIKDDTIIPIMIELVPKEEDKDGEEQSKQE